MDDFRKARAIVEAEARRRYDTICDEFEPISELCESPIEAALAGALYAYSLDEPRFRFLDPARTDVSRNGLATIWPQGKIGNYRVDFCIRDASGGEVQFYAIECDGHDFHETKEAAQRDKERDRFLLFNGCKVLRFTGSEINADAHLCAISIVAHLGFARRDYERRKESGG